MPPASPAATTPTERDQALRDYKLTIEYKHLKQNAPAGVFLVPSIDDLRLFYGFIIVRKGLYANGVFKFLIRIPPLYNDVDTWPVITFSSFVYNPMVNPMTGEMDVRAAFPSWDPTKHFLVTLLTQLKKIFYAKEYPPVEKVANPEARRLFVEDKDEYRKKVEFCVAESQNSIYENDRGSTLVMREDQVRYQALRHLMLKKPDATSIPRARILEMIDKADKKFAGR